MLGLLFTYGLTYGGALAAIFSPYTGILVYVCLAFIKPESLWPWSVPLGNYSRIVAIATLAGWVIKGFGTWNFGKARGIVVSILGLLLWSSLGAVIALDQDVAWSFVDRLAKIVVPVVVGVSLIQSAAHLRQLAWVISLSHGYLALEFNRIYYAGYFIPGEFSFADMEEGSIAIGMICATGFSLFFSLYQKVWWKRILLLCSAALTGHVVLFSFSRGGIMGLLTSLVVAFLISKKDPKNLLVLTLVLLVGLRLAGPQVRARFATSFVGADQRDGSAQSRVELWGACWQTMLIHPILGIGPDHWTVTGNKAFKGQITHYSDKKEAHTLWLQLGAELGFPGLLFILSFYIICIIRLWPFARRMMTADARRGLASDDDPWIGYAACMVIVSLCGFMVSAQFISLEFLEVPYYIALLGAGALKVSNTRVSSCEKYHEGIHAGRSVAVPA